MIKIILGILLFIAVIIIIALYRRLKYVTAQKSGLERLVKEQAGSQEKENQLTIMNQKIKYDVLQNQINPHFLYNTLENIRGQAILDGNRLIADMTEALARYFRYNISKDGDVVKLAQEIENIRTYIQIQKYRFRDRIIFHVYNHVDDEMLERCKIPKMTLQPIVENAIFYGVESKTEQGHIDVHVDIVGECVSIIVSDDGQGMKKEKLEKLNQRIKSGREGKKDAGSGRGNGIAITNINKRIQLLYGEEYGLHVSSIWNVGTEVGIVFPYMEE